MTGKISVISLKKLLDALDDEELLNNILNGFTCRKNLEVEKFLKEDAIEFNKKGLASTYLVVLSNEDNNFILGYFTLAMKAFLITDMQEMDEGLSKTQKNRIMRFISQYHSEVNGQSIGFYVATAALIAQLGKNDLYAHLVKGSDLLAYAYAIIKEVQALIGGRFVFVEREENDKLDEFYRNNGFINLHSRESSSVKLYQMFKYIK